MRRKSKVFAIVLAIALVATQFALLPSLALAEEPVTRVPDNILNEAKENRTPIIWFDFEDVEPGDSTTRDKISGIVATYGEQKKENEVPTQYVTNIPVIDYLTLSGKAFQPTGNRDLIMPYEPLSQTGDEASIQVWIRMAQIENWHNLFWATSIKGHTQDVQQSNFIGIHPKRGDTNALSFIVGDKAKGGNEGAAKVAAQENLTPPLGEWALITVTQKGTSVKIYLNDQEVASGTVHYPMSQLYDKIKATDASLTMDDVKMGIGCFTDGWWDDTLHALVDDFKIYNVELTAEEISAEYNSKKALIDSMPMMAFNVQQIGGHSAHLPDLTRTAPASRDWGEFVWGVWHDNLKGELYLKTFVKVTKVPGKENSENPVAYFDYQMGNQSQARWPMPAVKDFENGIWKSIVVKATVDKDGRKEFRFQNRNLDEIYNITVGPVFVIDDNDTPLELPSVLKEQNEKYDEVINSFPNYRPAIFNEQTGIVYKMDGVRYDNLSHNDRSYVTITPNGNYLTTVKDLHNHLTWNGYPDRFGKNNGLPAGSYEIIFAYKAEGVAYAKSSQEGFGKWEWTDKYGFFGNEETLDGQWHIYRTTVEFPNGIAGNAEFRIRNEWHRGTFTLSVGQVFVIPRLPAIALEKNVFTVGEPITVHFGYLDLKTADDKEVNGIKIVREDGSDVPNADYWIDYPDPGRGINDPEGSFTYLFNEDGSDNKFKILLPGNYKMLLEAKGKAEIMSIPFTVVEDPEVASVIEAINNLPDASDVTLEDEDAIVAAREAYEALSESQKAKIGAELLAKLEAAEAALQALKEQPGTEPGTQPGTEPVPPTSDIFPVAMLSLLLAGAGVVLASRKRLVSKSR